MGLPKIVSVILLLIVTACFAFPLKPAKAVSPGTNILANGSFENGADSQGIPNNWSFQTCEGVANATAQVDTSAQKDGADSAKISTRGVTPSGCFPGNYAGRAVGFSQLRQGLSVGYNITQLSDDSAGFSFWFQLQPYNVSSGMAGFEVRVFGAEGLAELDYVFNPDPSVGVFVNNTSTHSLIFTGYQYGQWYHFSRDLRADWLTPMGSGNTPLNLNYNFTLLQFQGFATKSGNVIRSETFWLDDVRVYTGTLSSQPLLQVWSPDTHSNIIASTASTFEPGNTFTVMVNVTNAGPISGFDVSLDYAMSSSIAPPITTMVSQVSFSPGLFDGDSCNALVPKEEVLPAPYYRVHVSAVFLGTCSSPGALAGTGTLFSVQFNVTGTGTTSLDILATGPTIGQKQQLVVTSPPNIEPVPGLQVSDMIFQNVAGVLPVASFSYSPPNPALGIAVSFDATESYVPGNQSLSDHGIQKIIWSFDDWSTLVQGIFTGTDIVEHTFLLNPYTFGSGYFSVRLVVIGQNSQLMMRQEQVVYISPAAVDDISVSLTLSPATVHQGQTITGAATIRNNGNRAETANLNVTINNPQRPQLGVDNEVSVPQSGESGFGFTIDTGNLSALTYTVTASVVMVNSTGVIPDPTPMDNVQSVLFTVLPPDAPPIANFTVRPSSPIAGHEVQFDGSASRDPDGYVVSWQWSFGDGNSAFGSFVYHTYASAGTYTVTLSVQDNGGLVNSTSRSIVVSPPPAHDVGIVYIQAYPYRAVSSQTVYIQVVLVNNGNNTETVSVTAYYGGHVAGSLNSIVLYPTSYYYDYVTVQWDTTGIAPGNYTISATVFLPTDEHPGDNSLSDGLVQILPPPVLTVSPSNGPLGTEVQVVGSGYAFYYPYPSQVLVTFDDQFVGFGTGFNGSFSFTFNIPLAQAGIHYVKAIDGYGAHAMASFMITQAPSTSKVDVSTSGGGLYFPGDQAVVFVQTRVNGQPVSVSGLQIVLVRPSGPNVTLTAIVVSPGVWKVTYTVPATGGFGTYAVVVKAHQSGSQDGTGLFVFEVKPSWLQAHSSAIVGLTAVLSMVGGVVFAWRKGYLKRKQDKFSFL